MAEARFTMAKDRTPEIEYMGVIMARFVQQVGKKAVREINGGLTPDFPEVTITTELLREWRTRLARTVRKGMNERKDMEIEIAYLAAVVWFLRQVDEEKWVEPTGDMW